MKQIECPICHEVYDEDVACPRCSFEFHQIFTPSKHFQEIEQMRIAVHTKWWTEQLEKKVDRSEYDVKVQELNDANNRIAELERELEKSKKPVAFLISEQKAVYCLYEGINTFGSAKTNSECKQHQKIILPGISIRPAHFSIIVTSEENRKRCVINELGSEPTSLFVNSTTTGVLKDTLLNDSDEIIISVGKNECRIKFRININ